MNRTEESLSVLEIINQVNLCIQSIRNVYSRWCRENRINYNEFLLYYTMFYKSPCTQRDVCEMFMIPKQTMNNLIKSMQKNGLVKLEGAETTRREKYIILTRAGKVKMDKIMDEVSSKEIRNLELINTEKIIQMTETAKLYGIGLEKAFEEINT